MNRLQKKCFIASTGVHLLLVGILFIGPGFLSSPPKQDDVRTLTMLSPDILTDSPYYNTGAGPAAPRLPTPTPPTPTPPAPKPESTPDPEPVRPNRRQTEAVELTSHTPRLPQVSLTPTTRKARDEKKQTSNTSTADRDRKAAEADRRARAAAVSQALSALDGGGSSVSKVSDQFSGADGVGPSYAPYAALVKTIYENAWMIPEDATSDDAITKASVTISSDGSILSSHIIKRSGDSQMDASVQRCLDRVARRGIGRPFPEGAKDKERTYIIPFNLQIKKGI